MRYYEEIGLLDPIERAANGHRRYQTRDLARIQLLKRLRQTDMSIEEMKTFIGLYREGDHTTAIRRQMLETHRASIDAKIAELLEIRDFIDYKIERYQEQEEANTHEISSTG